VHKGGRGQGESWGQPLVLWSRGEVREKWVEPWLKTTKKKIEPPLKTKIKWGEKKIPERKTLPPSRVEEGEGGGNSRKK